MGIVKEFKSPEDKGKYAWVDLEEIVKQSHYCFQATHMLPCFIENPETSFVVNVLFPIENELEKWNIRKLIETLSTKSLVKEAVKRRKLKIEEDTICPLILNKMCVGELQKLEKEDLLNDIDINSAASSFLIDFIPFTRQWHEPQSKHYHQHFSTQLDAHKIQASIDDSIIGSYTALCAASLINELTPTENILLRNQNAPQYHGQAAAWLLTQLKGEPSFSNYLTDYLSSCAFENILTWCKDEQVGSYLFPHLEELIENKRIEQMNVTPLLISDYVFLKRNAKKLSPERIINWMDNWGVFGKDPLNWHSEVINDIIEHEPKNLLSVLTEYFNNEKIMKEEWLERIKTNHLTFVKIAHYLASKPEILNNQKSLQEALIAIPEGQENYDVELVSTLMKLINKDQEDAMLTSFRSNFLKNNTTQEKRYRIIKYFGSLTKMPNINDEYMETEIRAFLDDALSNGHDEAKNWLCAQSIKDSGWNISKWSIDNLRGLYILLNENPETKKEKLTLAVAKILNKLKSNAKTDSAASPEKAMADD